MQQINPETTNPPRLDSTELRTALSQFTGTEHWNRHSLNKRMLYTDGVRYLAKNGGELGAYWLLDKTALEICPLLHRKKTGVWRRFSECKPGSYRSYHRDGRQ